MRYLAGVLLLASPALAAQPPAPPPPVRVVAPPAPQMRGPLRNRAANIFTRVITDMTVKMAEELPRAVVDSVKRGDYEVELRSTVTPPAAAPAGVPVPPGTNQPVRNLIRRLAAPRP